MFTISLKYVGDNVVTISTDDPFGWMADAFAAFPSLTIVGITSVGR